MYCYLFNRDNSILFGVNVKKRPSSRKAKVSASFQSQREICSVSTMGTGLENCSFPRHRTKMRPGFEYSFFSPVLHPLFSFQFYTGCQLSNKRKNYNKFLYLRKIPRKTLWHRSEKMLLQKCEKFRLKYKNGFFFQNIIIR